MKFQIGDLVRLKNPRDSESKDAHEIIEVGSDNDDSFVCVLLDGYDTDEDTETWICESDLELVSTPNAPKTPVTHGWLRV